jgi:excisionase family DNA binding protein
MSNRSQHFLSPVDERQRYSLEEAAAYLRLSRSRIYEKIAAKELTPIKDGHRTFISGAEIARVSRIPA